VGWPNSFELLTNQAYIGNIVFSRVSYNLQQTTIKNPLDMWIRRERALAPIISPEIFAKARAIIAARRRGISDKRYSTAWWLALAQGHTFKQADLGNIWLAQSDYPHHALCFAHSRLSAHRISTCTSISLARG
jgi:hypothetical protein